MKPPYEFEASGAPIEEPIREIHLHKGCSLGSTTVIPHIQYVWSDEFRFAVLETIIGAWRSLDDWARFSNAATLRLNKFVGRPFLLQPGALIMDPSAVTLRDLVLDTQALAMDQVAVGTLFLVIDKWAYEP